MFVNNPQLSLYHHNIVEQKRILTKERLEKYHNTLDRIEKEMLEDYNKRVESRDSEEGEAGRPKGNPPIVATYSHS